MDYSPWFDFGSPKKVERKGYHQKGLLKEEQNGTSFSFVAPFSGELWVQETPL